MPATAAMAASTTSLCPHGSGQQSCAQGRNEYPTGHDSYYPPVLQGKKDGFAARDFIDNHLSYLDYRLDYFEVYFVFVRVALAAGGFGAAGVIAFTLPSRMARRSASQSFTVWLA